MNIFHHLLTLMSVQTCVIFIFSAEHKWINAKK